MKQLFVIVSVVTLSLGSFAPSPAQNIPGGSYRLTCQDIRVDGKRLLAKCENHHRQLVDAELELPCYGGIQNDGGKLRCYEDPYRVPPPRGSYQAYCRRIATYKTMLQAECRKPKSSDYSYRSSMLPLPCHGDISVDNDKKLICKI